MSDSKYSALPPAATLTGTEIFAVAQAGNSVRTTVSAVQNNALGTYTAPGVGAVAMTVATKLGERESVRDFGADPTGVVDCTASFSAAAAAFGASACAIWVPKGVYNGATGISAGSGRPLWIIPGEAQVNGGIQVGLGYDSRPGLQFSQTGTTANDYGAVTVRRTTSHTGGSPNNVNGGFRVDSYVGAGVTNIEWALIGVMQNSATAGQNTGIFGQGNKLAGAGPTFAATLEARDPSLVANPTTGLVGCEVDCRAAGTDSNLTRVGVDVVLSRPFISGVFSGAAATIAYGVRVGMGFGDTGATVGTAYTVWNGISCGYAFDCANATVTSGALRMAAGAAILFDGPGVNQLLYDGTGLRYNVSGSPVARINQSGITNLGVGAFGTSAALTTACTATTGITQASYQMSDTLSGTTESAGVLVANTIAAGVTAANYRGSHFKNATLGAAALITNQSAIYVDDLTAGGSLNVAANLNVLAGANKYNIYAAGTAPNFMAGALGINGNLPPGQVTGFGTPTGGGVIANFPGATATLAQTSQSVAQILLMLKAFGLGAA